MRLISLDNYLMQSRIPDIIVKGKMDDDGELKYKYYNDIPNLAIQLKEKLNSDIKIYSVVSRSLMTDRDPLTNNSVEYTIYGVTDEFFENEIRSELNKGEIPKQNEFQAVMGSYARNFYKVNISDNIEQPITLSKDWQKSDIGLYNLSGILNDNLAFFKGGVFVSRETFANHYEIMDDNMIYVYTNNKSDFDEALSAIQDLKMEDPSIGTITMNFYMKQNTIRNAWISGISISLFTVIIIILLMAYLMKGTSKKIGILKALGVPNKFFIIVFSGGISITLLISTGIAILCTHILAILFNKSLSSFLGYRVNEYSLNKYCIFIDLAFVIFCFIISFANIYILTNKTSPKEAMKNN